MNDAQFQELKDILAVPKKIVVVPHRNPDGDAIGSTTALNGYLKQLGHDSTIISPNDFPKFLKWIPTIDDIMIYENQKNQSDQLISDADIIFILDQNAFHRAGDMEEILSKTATTYVMIDHHQQPDDFAQFTQKELDDNGFKKGDTEGFVNYGLSLEGIVFALIFIENAADEIVKISLRSKGDFDVNLLAREHFNGGGHKNAAGGRSLVNLSQTEQKLITILPDYEKQLIETVI